MRFVVRPMQTGDVPGAIALQAAAFPPPFSEDLHWDPAHLSHHVQVFPEGQWVAEADGLIIASCSNILISEARWTPHATWMKTVGGPFLDFLDLGGTTLYGLDIAVHPAFRRRGVARALYNARFELVRKLQLIRYGTACRMPGWQAWAAAHEAANQTIYACQVVAGEVQDVTLTPLLRMGLSFLEVIPNYMPDEESGDAAALLEWRP